MDEKSNSRLKLLIDRWKDDPISWCIDILGDQILDEKAITEGKIDYELKPGTIYLTREHIEIINSIKDNKRVAIKGCNQSGKTFSVAHLALWYLYNHYSSIVLTTAPTNRQVEKILWKEIESAYNRSNIPLGGKFLTKQIKNISDNPKWYAMGFATKESDSAQRFQGFHEADILVIVDEANSVSQRIYDAIEGLLANNTAKLLLIGNPINPIGEFYKAFTTSTLYHRITISAYDTINLRLGKIIIPGMATKEWAEERKNEWGEGNPLYKSKVLAQFPESSVVKLIPLEWIELAIKRWKDNSFYGYKDDDQIICSVDVGQYGDDPSAYLWRRGNRILKVERHYRESTMSTAGRCAIEAKKGNKLIIDANGLGAGVADRLQEDGIPATAYKGSFGTNLRDKSGYLKFKNLRSCAWWYMRESFDPEGIIKLAIPDEKDLIADLTAPDFKYESGGVISVEKKEDVKKKVGRSTDLGDALAMSCVPVIRPVIEILTF